jgi:hypothetical protein
MFWDDDAMAWRVGEIAEVEGGVDGTTSLPFFTRLYT